MQQIQIRDATGSKIGASVDSKNRLCTHSVSIDYSHNEIHDGFMFEAFVSQETANSDDNMTIISFKTSSSNTLVPHMFAFANTSGQSWFYIYENPTIAASGGTSTATVFNRNRNAARKSEILDSDSIASQADYWDESDAAGADITLGDGTLVHQELLGANKSTFAQSRPEGERVLKPNTNYAFVLENEGAAANIHNIILNWYEDEPEG